MDMTDEDLLDRLASLVGIEPFYFDIFGGRHETSLETKAFTVSALGFDVSSVQALRTAVLAIDEEPWREGIAPVVVQYEDEAGIDLDLFLPADQAGRSWMWQIACESGEEVNGTFRPEDLPVLGARDIDGRRVEQRRLRLQQLLPIGYHRLCIGGEAAHEAALVLTPRQCHIPRELNATDRRRWGITAHLYTLRSERNWGIGDFGDLARLCDLAGRSGASVVATNPFHALFPQRPGDVSPYSPSSRLFLNPIYIDVTAVPGFSECPAARLSSATLSSLRATKLVNYPEVSTAKMQALEALFAAFQTRLTRNDTRDRESDQFRQFVAAGGAALAHFAAFSVLQELQCATGSEFVPWHRWPGSYRMPQGSEVARLVEEHSDRVRFFQYLQYLADLQLERAAERGRQAGLEIGLVRDLALGINPDGADAWMQQHVFAAALRCGAPPDAFHPGGQEWGVTPLNPMALRRDYSPFIALLRANMRHAGGLRVDHVIGLQRQFLIPVGRQPYQGCYVRYPLDELLAILALESHRHRCMVIGEDLGTVPQDFRDRLRSAGAFGTAVLYFEREADGRFRPPAEYREPVVASANTHDLPTLVGYWTGRDIAARREVGIYGEAEAREAQTQRRADRLRLLDAFAAAGLDVHAPTDNSSQAMRPFVQAAQAFLASSSARLFIAQLDDLLAEPEQINVPGTVSAYPNWRRKLSLTLEDAALVEAIKALAGICAQYGRARP